MRKQSWSKWAALAAAAAIVLGAGIALHLALRKGGTEEPRPQASPVREETLPLAGLTILVDPGHGGYDGGAKCRDSGKWEKEINLAVALAAEKALVQRGAVVVMTRRADEDLCGPDRPSGMTMKRQDMEKRVALARENGAGMVLSIHMNEYRDRRESGPQVFYRAGNAASRLLAGCMQEALVTGVRPAKKRECMAGDYFILQLEVPSVLVECGFISNSEDEAKLLESDYQSLLAESIAQGVMEYVSLAARLREGTEQKPPEAAR